MAAETQERKEGFVVKMNAMKSFGFIRTPLERDRFFNFCDIQTPGVGLGAAVTFIHQDADPGKHSHRAIDIRALKQ